MSSRKKKILFIVSNLKIGGGAENYVSLLSKGVSSFYDVEILTYYKFKEEYSINCKRFNFNYKYSNNFLVKVFRLLVVFPFLTHRFLKKKKYDYIVSNAEDANVVTLLNKILYRSNKNSKYCAIIHNNLDLGVYKHTQFLHKKADVLFTVSNSLTQLYIKKFNSKNIFTLYNPFDFKEIEDLKKEKI